MKSHYNKIVYTIVVLIIALLSMAARGYQQTITIPPITAFSLAIILGAILSGVADYFPGLAAKFDALTVEQKRLTMAIGAIVIVVAVFAGGCANLFQTDMVCTPAGAYDVVTNIILVFVVGQGTHAGTKPTAAFKADVLKIPPSNAPAVTPAG